MKFQKSQPAEAAHASASHCLLKPLRSIAAPPPAKAHTQEIPEKAVSISSTCVRLPVWGDMKKGLSSLQVLSTS